VNDKNKVILTVTIGLAVIFFGMFSKDMATQLISIFLFLYFSRKFIIGIKIKTGVRCV